MQSAGKARGLKRGYSPLHVREEKQRSRTLQEQEAKAVAVVACNRTAVAMKDSAREPVQSQEREKDMLLESLEAIQRTASAVLDQMIESKTTRR